MIVIKALTPEQARACIAALSDLLRDAVESGASVGFIPPISDHEIHNYWMGVLGEMDAERRILLVALASGELVGAVQVDPAPLPNASHRAEVMKLFVYRRVRRQGIGRSLMAAAESAAREIGRTLLILNTRQGDVSENLYVQMGYTRVGTIPRYARSADGTLRDTVFFYKEIPPQE
jgi:acetyltransferase